MSIFWINRPLALFSLPLMGIRNHSTILLVLSQPYPHYPSWGLGMQLRVKCWLLGTSSLPLMGIRNSHIGGRKRNRGTAHYPSWGLGI